MQTDAVIIGGGIAGIQCATHLSSLGLQSVIVEKAPFLGGHVARLACKATDRCRRCGACALEDVLRRMVSSGSVRQLVRTTVERVEERNGGFSLTLSRRPVRIFPERCGQCGECERVCPADGALVRVPGGNGIVLDEDKCLFFKDGSCRACMEACPDLAINLDEGSDALTLNASAVIVATGFTPFDPEIKPRFGYGLVPGVVTALEMDSMLRNDTWFPGEGEGAIQSAAFIQCVGSRDVAIGRNYCSRVCCGYAVRMARLLKYRFPALRPTMFYMDIQSFERAFDKTLQEASQEVRLIRSIPAEIRKGGDGRPEVVYHGPDDQRVMESFDLVILSIGISPASSEPFSGLGRTRDGFCGLDGEEVTTLKKGVFTAGTVQGPKSIGETLSHAMAAAGRAGSYVREMQSGGSQ
ncbi:MAG: FAD-dependent oxidoreductase [Pseudomonadota bacterium]